MNFKKLLSSVFKKGITFGYSTGKPFDPAYQERTDPMDDIRKAQDRKRRLKKRSEGRGCDE